MSFSSRSLVSVLLVIISIALGYFVLKPKWDGYSAAKAKVSAAQAEQDKLKLAQQQLNKFIDEYKTHAEQAKLLNQSLPLSKTEMANILNSLDTLTKTSGMTLGQLSIVETPGSDQLGAAPNSIQPIDLAISGSGTYDSFKVFLGKLENNLRIIDISNISMDTGEGLDVTFSMNFRTYYQQ